MAARLWPRPCLATWAWLLLRRLPGPLAGRAGSGVARKKAGRAGSSMMSTSDHRAGAMVGMAAGAMVPSGAGTGMAGVAGGMIGGTRTGVVSGMSSSMMSVVVAGGGRLRAGMAGAGRSVRGAAGMRASTRAGVGGAAGRRRSAATSAPGTSVRDGVTRACCCMQPWLGAERERVGVLGVLV